MANLKTMIAKAAESNGETADELADGEVPDVCYVLQFDGMTGQPVVVHRSAKPIKLQLDAVPEDPVAPSSRKSVLEIVTQVSTSWVSRKYRRPVHHNRTTRRLNRGYDDYDDLDYRRGPPPPPPRDLPAAEAKLVNVENTVMLIRSLHLINALRAVIGYYPAALFIGDCVRIEAPYQALVHNRQALAHYKAHQPEGHSPEYAATTAEHIDVLLNFLDKTLGQEIRAEEARWASSTPKATFENLWMMYQPGEVVYAQQDKEWTPFVVSRILDGPSKSRSDEGPLPYLIECWNIAYLNQRFVREMYSVSIEPFTGEDAISSLQAIPSRFFQGSDKSADPAKIAEEHIALGKRVWELAQAPAYLSYNGNLVDKESDVGYDMVGATGNMKGRVIVDCEGFSRYSIDDPSGHRRRARPPPPAHLNRPPIVPADQLPHFAARCGCPACSRLNSDNNSNSNNKDELSRFANFEGLDPIKDKRPQSDLYYLVLSKTVPGFILADRRWGHLSVRHLEEIKFDKEAFKYLVLDEEIKLTVKSLIGKFASDKGRVTPWPNDFVKHKGQGRIFLLHGSPGVGKTCTAECIAELTHRPLLSLTSGDLSTTSYTVEKNLEYFLQLGERFGAMVLLDEADVYLEARRARDIARNGLVSVFLRALEYYRGVLFLTTNRVRAFDAAFTSRIHVALHYGPLRDADRERIWVNSFDRLERDSAGRVHVSSASRDYVYASPEVAALRWNGREIRNALQTAVALADTEADEDGQERVIVADKHMRAVVKMSRGFKDFLRRRRYGDEDEGRGYGYDDDDDDDDDDEDEELDDESRERLYD